MKIYIAGGSSEMDLVGIQMGLVRAMGHTITYDWVSTIISVGAANPRDATHRQRMRWCDEDLRGIENAHMVWIILPAKTSFGCAFEAGFACGNGQKFIVSGDWRASIFSSRALARFDEHHHAISWLQLYRTPGSHEETMESLEAE
jgi:hypothetical protein